jgi:hypothetical protein
MLYAVLVVWEQKHVAQHMETIRHPLGRRSVEGPDTTPPALAA